MLTDKTIGIALSGGGTRGAFHLGFLQALDLMQQRIKAVSGTSIGSAVGAFYCAGYAPDEIMDIFTSQSVFSVFRIAGSKRGLMELRGLRRLLKEKVPDDFEALKIPLTVVATDLDDDNPVVIDRGPLHDAVVASCSIPVLFQSTRFNGRECVDGGLLNNMPADVLKGKVEKIIGVHVNKFRVPEGHETIRSLADRVFSFITRQNVMRSKQYCDYFIEPELMYHNVLDFRHLDELYRRGQEMGKQFLEHPNNFAVVKRSPDPKGNVVTA